MRIDCHLRRSVFAAARVLLLGIACLAPPLEAAESVPQLAEPSALTRLLGSAFGYGFRSAAN